MESAAILDQVAPHAEGHTAYEFVRAWHGIGHYSSLIAVNQLRAAGVGGVLKTIAAPLQTVMELLNEGDLDELVYEGQHRWNLYHSAGFLIRKPEKNRRSGKNNIAGVPGVWLDLDVKTGAFADEDDALAFVHTLPLRPTLLVATGTGGVQAYWRTSEVMLPDQAEELCVRWWQLADRMAECAVDKIQNRDRIMRLPGSVRWPKGGEAPALVRLLSTDGPPCTAEQLYAWTEQVHREAQERRRDARESVERGRGLAASAINQMNRWQVLEMITYLEDEFNERYEWADVLQPHGWENVGTDYDGRTLWSRPGGQGRKSATTDWSESPHVMSLFSDAEETGLRRLADAGVPLTKYRVFIELTWGGNEEAFVRAWVKQLEDEGRVE